METGVESYTTDGYYIGQLLTHDQARGLIDSLSLKMWRRYKIRRFNKGHSVDLTPTVAVVKLGNDAFMYNTV